MSPPFERQGTQFRREVCKWHEPSVPATARVGPKVGVELPVLPAGALTFRNGRETARGQRAVLRAARDPMLPKSEPCRSAVMAAFANC